MLSLIIDRRLCFGKPIKACFKSNFRLEKKEIDLQLVILTRINLGSEVQVHLFVCMVYVLPIA